MFDHARNVTVLTGVGISAESGVATFRRYRDSGIWGRRGRLVNELSLTELIAKDPKHVWDLLSYRCEMVSHIESSPGHHAVLDLS